MLRLTVERKKRGWTKTELAFRAQLHPSTIGKLESGELKPFPKYKRVLSEIFEVPAEELFNQTEEVAQ
ncbi:MAG: helix-turn-helix transcriptional regulator [Firmicutes bacterium]|jgi:transcriptional regulator with XRE-family HTH domain|nr:helix-turn-helix transcriptional regulator [Bacillota bacterium]